MIDIVTKNMKSVPVVLIVLNLLLSCSNVRDGSGNSELVKLDIDNCTRYVDLKLSDLIDSCDLIRLETTTECLLDQYINSIFIGNKYILIRDRNGVYKFSKSGNFISKILNVGRGPEEISYAITSFYDEQKDILYFDDIGRKDRDYINVYDVGSEMFLNPIPKSFKIPWSNFIITNDSIIISSLLPSARGSIDDIKRADTIPYALFFQNLKGNFLGGIMSNKKYLYFDSKVLQRASIIPVGNDIHVRYQYDDTLFILNDGKLYPYLIPIYNTQKTELPTEPPISGERQTFFDRYGNTSFLIITNTYTKGLIAPGKRIEYETTHLILNKTNGKYGWIKSYTDDFSGKFQTNENHEAMKFPSPLPGNKLFVLYYPEDFINRRLTDFNGMLIPENTHRKLDDIISNINETDNPILLIGKVKKGILTP